MVETTIMSYFKAVIVVMLFYSVCITMITYALPADARVQTQIFSNFNEDISLEGTSTLVEDSIQEQTNIPVVEVGALVFYSGNIILDLMLNFAFAIPEMLGLLVNGFMLLFNVDSYLFAIVEIFASVAVTIMYMIGLIQLLTGIRSGRMV